VKNYFPERANFVRAPALRVPMPGYHPPPGMIQFDFVEPSDPSRYAPVLRGEALPSQSDINKISFLRKVCNVVGDFRLCQWGAPSRPRQIKLVRRATTPLPAVCGNSARPHEILRKTRGGGAWIVQIGDHHKSKAALAQKI